MKHDARRIRYVAAVAALLFSTYGCDRVREAFSGDDPQDEHAENNDVDIAQADDDERASADDEPHILIRSSENSENDVRIPLSATQPHRIQGDIIGRKPASEFGVGCTGYIGETPTFAFDVEGDEPVETAVAVIKAGGIDTTLVIDGPGGPYCDDDSGGSTLPRVRAALPPGSYTAYIGAYSENQGAHYQASIGPAQPLFEVSDCDSSTTIEIGEGFDAQNISGTLGENMRACSDGVDIVCAGHLSNTAGPCVEVTSRQIVRFSVTQASFDSIMILQSQSDASSVYNDDGSADMKSEIITALEPGRYALHVGAYDSTARGSWTVKAEQLDIAIDTNGNVSPQPAENCEVLTEGNVISLVGNTAPEFSCNLFFPDTNCIGTVPKKANHCIEAANGMSVDVEITEANFDTVLYMTGDSLLLSDDDGAGGTNLLSKISTPLPSGTYQLFIGSIDPRQAGPYRLQITPR